MSSTQYPITFALKSRRTAILSFFAPRRSDGYALLQENDNLTRTTQFQLSKELQ